jgi:uncharacterized protein DUF6893
MKVEMTPTAKLLVLGVVGLILAAIGIAQAPDARRYMKMEQM